MTFDWERFKQSNVARIFVAYAVVVFASMQILDYLLPIIEAPNPHNRPIPRIPNKFTYRLGLPENKRGPLRGQVKS